jgi:hypothetical protein
VKIKIFPFNPFAGQAETNLQAGMPFGLPFPGRIPTAFEVDLRLGTVYCNDRQRYQLLDLIVGLSSAAPPWVPEA